MAVTNRVHLLLGFACNHHCRYCVQEIHGRPTGFKKTVSQKTVDILNDMARLAAPRLLRITFFGGEPLLYLPAIKDLLSRVKHPNIVWKAHSNGEYLSDEVVELFNKNNVHFGLSHDGPNVLKTRGVDVLTNPDRIRLFNRFNSKAVDFVVTSYTQDFYEVYDYFRQVLGTNDWRLKPAFLVNPSEVPEDMLQFDFDHWERTVERLCTQAKAQILARRFQEPQSWESAVLARAIGDCLDPVEDSPFVRRNERCMVMHLDLSGNISMCERLERHRLKVFTAVKDKTEFDGAFFGYTVVKHPHCDKCPAFRYCRGQCPVEDVSQAPQQCHLLQILYRHINATHKALFAEDPLALRDALLPHLSPEFRAAHGFTEIVPERAPQGSAA